MDVLVPFSADQPKSRLSRVLSPAERSSFARAMLRDVLEAVAAAGGDPTVLANAPIGTGVADTDPDSGVDVATDTDLSADIDAEVSVIVDERPLTPAVNAALKAWFADGAAAPIAVVMADLALATPQSLRELFAAGDDTALAIAPGRGGGTNALVVSTPSFHVDYHGASYLDHRRIAREIGASVSVVDSHRLATDVDEPGDLAELLIHRDASSHASCRSAAWLADAGFQLDTTAGRVGIERTDQS